VLFIIMSMEQGAEFVDAQIIKLEIHKHAKSIKVYGLGILQITPARICLDLEGHCVGHLRAFLGSKVLHQAHNPMMNLLLKYSVQPISWLQDFIVLKQFVHPVE
jgi:hypothetical protein